MTRVQRRRINGWRLPSDAVVVDRTSRFGNPFPDDGDAYTAVEAVRRFQAWMHGYGPEVVFHGGRPFDRRWMWANLHQLTGRRVCCFCPLDQPCHGDVLVDLANQHEEER